MFKIRPEVYESFQPSAQFAHRERILSGLRNKGLVACHHAATGDLVVTDDWGQQSRLSFDSNGSPTQLTLPSGNTWHIECDNKQRRTSIEDARGAVLLVERDQEGRLTRLGHPGISEHRFTYDASSRLTELEYPDGTSTRLLYNDLGTLDGTIDRTGAKTSYEYSPRGSLSGIMDPLGRRTSFELDAKGRARALRFPDGSNYSFQEDAATGTRRMTLRDGSAVLQRFVDGRLESVTWADGEEVQFESDEAGNIRKAFRVGEQRTSECNFSAGGYLTSEVNGSESILYEYGAGERLNSIQGPNAYLVEYGYDVDGNLEVIRSRGEVLYHRSHDWRTGAITSTWGNGLVETQQHGGHGEVARTTLRDPSGWLVTESEVAYDQCHRLVRILDAWGGEPEKRIDRELSYDREGRLLGEKDANSGAVLAEYDYDAKGNLVYDCGDYVEFGPMDEPLSRGGERILYDANGAVQELPGPEGPLRCTFSARGFMRQVAVGGRCIQFEYDALGRRSAKRDGPRQWRYLWAGCQLLAEELWENEELIASREYIYLPDSATPLAFREGGRTYWLQADARGAIVRAFDDQGELVWLARYDSFGQASIELEEVRQPWRLVGQYEDEETGLYYNFARYYCPWHRSYLSLDPQWMRHGATNYSYAANDPWNRIDPLGAFAFVPILIAVAIGAVLGAAIGAGIAWYFHASTQDIVAAAIGGAVGGALMGLGVELLLAAGVTGGMLYLGLAGTGFVSGAAQELVAELLDSHEGICIPCVLIAGGISAVLTPVLFVFGRWLGSTRFGRWLAGKLRLRAPERPVPESSVPETPLESAEAEAVVGESGEGGSAGRTGEAADESTRVRRAGESKGAFGERRTEEELNRLGYERISRDKHPNANGIDGVYQNSNPPPQYIIVESKYGTSRLGTTRDGPQMSHDWINGSKTGFDRLEDAVGKKQASAIRDAWANGEVDSVLAHTDSSGNVTFHQLDSNGSVAGGWSPPAPQ